MCCFRAAFGYSGSIRWISRAIAACVGIASIFELPLPDPAVSFGNTAAAGSFEDDFDSWAVRDPEPVLWFPTRTGLSEGPGLLGVLSFSTGCRNSALRIGCR